MKYTRHALIAALILGNTGTSFGAIAYTTQIAPNTAGDPFMNPALSGSSSSSSWLNVRGGGSVSAADGGSGDTGPNTGSFPGSTPWSGFAAQVGDTTAQLSKISNGMGGGAYRASGSFYYGGFSSATNFDGGTLGVTDDSPVVADLQTLVFQLQIGEAWGYDFHNRALPVLSYTTATGTVSNVASDYNNITHRVYNGTVTMPTGKGAVVHQHLRPPVGPERSDRGHQQLHDLLHRGPARPALRSPPRPERNELQRSESRARADIRIAWSVRCHRSRAAPPPRCAFHRQPRAMRR